MFSRNRRRQLDSEEELYEVAVRALARRAHSVAEMKRKLERYSPNRLLVRVVVARLLESGRLDDPAFARQFTRLRSQSRKQGQLRIASELRARGVSDADVRSAFEALAEETDQLALLRERIARKLKTFRGGSSREIDEKRMASLYGALLRAGFPADLIRRELKRLASSELREAAPPDSVE
jgi:regulatory protein